MPLSNAQKFMAVAAVAVVIIIIIVLAVSLSGGSAAAGGVAGGAAGANAKSGRYVYIERVAPGLAGQGDAADVNVIHLDDVKVFGPDGSTLMVGSTVTAGSQYGGYGPAFLTDAAAGTFASTASAGTDYTNVWFKVDLGSNKSIDKIVLTNRSSCCQNRAVGIRVRVTNADGKTIYTGPTITSAQATYTFTL